MKKNNNELAAICGLFCGTCSAYPIDCLGCLSDKCSCDCYNGFKDCARENGVTRCFECVSFPCQKLKVFSTQHIVNGICHHEKVIENLSNMRSDGIEAWVKKQEEETTCNKCGKTIIWYDKNLHKCK